MLGEGQNEHAVRNKPAFVRELILRLLAENPAARPDAAATMGMLHSLKNP
jgi:hypothetical protein